MVNGRFLAMLLILCPVLFGCRGEENAVIVPGEDYQLNEQEQAYKEAEDKMRSEGN